jgi:hypothetical protein
MRAYSILGLTQASTSAPDAQKRRADSKTRYRECRQSASSCKRERRCWEEYNSAWVCTRIPCLNVSHLWLLVNLAFALALRKHPKTNNPLRVGILDLDIFGPSMPTLMGLQKAGEPDLTSSA